MIYREDLSLLSRRQETVKTYILSVSVSANKKGSLVFHSHAQDFYARYAL